MWYILQSIFFRHFLGLSLILGAHIQIKRQKEEQLRYDMISQPEKKHLLENQAGGMFVGETYHHHVLEPPISPLILKFLHPHNKYFLICFLLCFLAQQGQSCEGSALLVLPFHNSFIFVLANIICNFFFFNPMELSGVKPSRNNKACTHKLS